MNDRTLTSNPKGYTQYVPGQCDRIVWRGSVYMLPLPSTPSPDETSELRFHEGERQSYLKAVELSVASGLLGDGDRSDLLQMYQRLWPRAPADIRADALKSENQTVEQMFVQCPCGCGSLIPWGPAQKANSCVCGEPNSPGTHRTDGPCLAPIGDHHP